MTWAMISIWCAKRACPCPLSPHHPSTDMHAPNRQRALERPLSPRKKDKEHLWAPEPADGGPGPTPAAPRVPTRRDPEGGHGDAAAPAGIPCAPGRAARCQRADGPDALGAQRALQPLAGPLAAWGGRGHTDGVGGDGGVVRWRGKQAHRPAHPPAARSGPFRFRRGGGRAATQHLRRGHVRAVFSFFSFPTPQRLLGLTRPLMACQTACVRNREKRHGDILEVLHAFIIGYHVRKCRRLMDDYLM